MCRFRVTKVLIIDNGKQFISRKFKSFYVGLSNDMRYFFIAHPHSNG